jgi:hypothetical protein
MTAKRNYDVEQITKNTIVDDSWLKPQETSVKSEKMSKESQPINESRFKYLNMDNQESSPTKKSVTWGNNTETSDSEFEENIFKKLKKVQKPEMDFDNISLNIEELNNNENNDDKIRELQSEVKTLNSKLDMIINLLQKNN